VTQVETDVQILDRISSTVRKLVDKKDAPIAEAVVHAIVQSLPRGDLAAGDPEGLATGCVQFWRFGNERKPSEPLVRIYTPTEHDDDWRCEHTIIEIVSDDMPFLVDSVVAALGRFKASVQLLIHPILSVKRDAAGRLTGVGESDDATAESWIHLRIDPQPATTYAEIEKELRIVLADVRVVVEDWQAIRAKTHAIVAELESNPPPLPAEEIDEGVRFLNWMDDHHFTFLGYRLCNFKGEKEETVARIEPGLGLLRDPEYTVFDGMRNLGAVPAEVRHFVQEPSLLRITKANRRGRVHRPVHLDTIAVKRFNKKGEVIGDHLFLGLFTAAAYSRSPRYIPLLRQRVARTIERAGFTRASHNGKALQHILETYPRDELFQIREDDLFEISMGILGLQERQQIAFYVRRDPFERFVSCLLFIPRDRYDTRMRIQAQKILEDAYDGKVDAFYTHMTDEPFARLHIIVRTKRGAIPDISREEVERRLIEAGRLWSDRVREQLLETHGAEEALRLARRYKRASAAYEEEHDATTAVHDIDHMERAFASPDGLSLHLHRDPEDDDDVVRVKVFLRGSPVPLSDVLPKLENMGMRVIEEYPYRVRLDTGEHGSIHDFVTRLQGRTMKLDRVRDVFHEAFRAVWNGETENDGFNRLVLGVGLSCRDVTVLRAYCKFLLQARIPFSQAYMEQTLANNAEIARILIEFFRCRFDPERHGVGLDVAADLAEEVRLLLDDVTNLDEDRIIRRFLNAMEATVRTNFYQTGDDGEPKPALAIKIDSQKIDELPLPKPFREIFVYSPRVEAVHLRGGEVARGGIRWSDRREDFRTEVLGLMKAQMVKNAVIVPVGSKGGFVVKCLPDGGRDEVQAEVQECYRIMMRALLDVTDNLEGDAIVPPPDLRIHDEDDPYLVVAADKGTATFSDIANSISMDHGFWLDDAFASGGSAGYDHKVMGITARGAWESVKRHFREAGKDTQTEDFTVVGVGDMSGDASG